GGDLVDRRRRVPLLLEEPLRGGQDPLPRGASLALGSLTTLRRVVGAFGPLGHAIDSRGRICAESSSTLKLSTSEELMNQSIADTTTQGTRATTALERAYDDLASVVAALTTDQLTAPTNCPGWDVRALLDHTLGTAEMFTKVNAGELVGEDAGDVVGDDPRGAVARIAATNLDAWRAPGALDGMR